MIKNLLFDMGGVIFKQDTQEAFRRFGKMGIDTDYYMGEYGQKDFFLDFEKGDIGIDEFCKKMAFAAKRESVSLAEAQYCWLGFIKEVPVERLRQLALLKEKYHLGLLSNTNPMVMGFTNSEYFSTDRLPISHYFHSLFLSYEMKVCKPSPEIFLKSMARDGLKADETIFIDDSMANIKAAAQLGLHCLHVKENEDWMPMLDEKLSVLG